MAIQVGDRVLIAKEKATVRYVGEVAGQSGTWVGVEWDDPSRGKHDGSTGGVRYFTTLNGPASGSFVRAEKVNAGVDVLSALRARYRNERAEGSAGDPSAGDRVYLDTSRRRILVEMVGEESVQARQSQLNMLTRARLVGFQVARAAASADGGKQEEQGQVEGGCTAAQLAQEAPLIEELDLTDNLLSSWAPVPVLCAALPRLALLNLSCNALALPASPAALPGGALTALTGLVLNGCRVGWRQLCALQCRLPRLVELHACDNGIADLSEGEGAGCGAADGGSPHPAAAAPPAPFFSRLEVLNLDGNALSAWSEVERLALLPSLRRLHLSGNPLEAVAAPRPAELGGLPGFASLEALFLGGCRLGGWASVDQLDAFPKLRELRLSGNPFLEGAKSGGRYEIIGRIAALTMLNGADIKPRDRRDAEVRYAQNVISELAELPTAEAREAHEAAHPRFAALRARYGAVLVATGTKGAGAGAALSTGMAALKLVHVDAEGGGRTLAKKLPKSTTVGALKLLAEKLFRGGPRADEMAVAIRLAHAPDALEDVSEDDARTLGWLGLSDGDEVHFSAADPEAKRLAAEAAEAARRAELEERAAQQLRDGDRLKAAAVTIA